MTKQKTVEFELNPITKAMSRTPMVLLVYQQDWCADTSYVKVAEKSRRIGLTWAEAADSALLAASANGMDTWYVGYNKDMALEFIRDCANWAKFYGLAASEIEETQEVFKEGKDEESILAFTIRFASGWRITALSSSPSNLRGKQGRVIIDEAAFHPCLSELLKAAMALLMWGGQVHIISTHDGVDNPFNELCQEIREGKNLIAYTPLRSVMRWKTVCMNVFAYVLIALIQKKVKLNGKPVFGLLMVKMPPKNWIAYLKTLEVNGYPEP